MCPVCAATNWDKRHQRTDLSGRIAIVTGGRVKIGFQTTLKLLRDGAAALVTTRFPKDAEQRYRNEPDWADWCGRLQFHRLDLRDLPAVEAFTQHVLEHVPHLDILIHNAAQTVKRPLAFYRHLLASESSATRLAGAVEPESPGELAPTDRHFPAGCFDLDGQQIDLRPFNSWRQRLGDLGTVELLEVLLVSAVSPCMLSNHLLPVLLRSPHPRRFIVNVSAMEGQFARPTKNAFHPQTRTWRRRQHSTCWRGDRRRRLSQAARRLSLLPTASTPAGSPTNGRIPRAERIREKDGFHVPLDAIDGASRIYDPIARGLNEPAEPIHGCFLKDYSPYPW